MMHCAMRLIAISACVSLWAVRALAIPGLNIWPSKVEMTVASGAIKTGVLAVQNQGVSTRTLQVLAVNCRMNQDGSLTYLNEDDQYGCRSWIRTSAQEITINPRANYQLLYSVKVPVTAAGSYIAAILFADASRALTPQEYQDLPGTIILQTVPNTGVKAADLLGLMMQRNQDDANYSVMLTLQNRGNLTLVPSGQLQVFAEDGSERLKVPINEGKEMVLPGSTRQLLVPLEANLEAGSYKVTATIDYGSLELLQGETTVFIKSGEIVYQKGGDKTPRPAQPGTVQPPDQPPPVSGKLPIQGASAKLGKGDLEQLIKTGTSLYSSGEYARSLAVWQKILKIDPRNAAAKKNMERTKQKLKAQKNAKG
jgi:hypothetical protein